MQAQPSLDFSRGELSHLQVKDAALAQFHPVVGAWFEQRLGEPTEPQRLAWPRIAAGRDVLLSAPTGSGKTLAAFLACVNRLFIESLQGTLSDDIRIVYVSPLRALSNDVQKNLLKPLQELAELARQHGLAPQPIRVAVRTGDTPARERAQMLRHPPHILITTPESLFLCLTAERTRGLLNRVETVIVDEIHALLRDKRGSHLALSLERLKDLAAATPQMIGLSATQRPITRVAAFLTAKPEADVATTCDIIEVGHQRPWQLRVEVPDEPLSCVASHEMWGQVYERIMAWSREYRTLLVFVNTRRLAERMAHDLGERLGDESLVRAHHGSMSREARLEAEERLKAGSLRIMVATASLELGIDIGTIDLVVQIGSPRAMSTALQRVGRAGHHKAGISRGAFVALTRDELIEVTALLDAIRRGELDQLVIPQKPLDILAQHVIAAVAAMPQQEDELFAWVKRAWSYRDLTRAEFDSVLALVSEGITTNRGKLRTLVFRDRTTSTLRPKPAARIVALSNAGAIPDTFSYPVIAEPEGKAVGSVDEDFAIDSMAGDVFLLGSTAWRIQRVIAGTVRVEDASGQPPSVPFWQGEAPSRTFELSTAVSRFREEVITRGDEADAWLQELGLEAFARTQVLEYLRASQHVLGVMPTQQTLVAERFFDEAGGMQLIIHSPFGGRINRAFGFALRKRFCRNFDFELQAAAGDDGVLLSLGPQHSFPLIDIFSFVSANVLDEVLTQAVLQVPLFGTRFRWNASRSLLLERMQRGERVPPQIQRARSDDLLAAIFPAQAGCQDNHGGEDVTLPDHPIVNETIKDCLTEALDIEGLRRVLTGIRDGSIRTIALDLPEPSPLAHQHLNSAPYTFLDDAPLEERRARAVSLRRTLPAADAVAFGSLDERAIDKVVSEVNLPPRSADELHEWLIERGVASWRSLCFGAREPSELVQAAIEGLLISRRATFATVVGEAGTERRYVVPIDRVQHWHAVYPGVPLVPHLDALPGDAALDRETALFDIVRGHVEIAGPVTSAELALELTVSEIEVEQAMARLELLGSVLRGHFRPGQPREPHEWCDRRLLQRIHRLTVGRLRSEIEPLAARDVMRFLLRWHGFDTGPGSNARLAKGRTGLLAAIDRLEGFEAPAVAWEKWLLEPRVQGYASEHLDRMCLSGELVWGRLLGEARTQGLVAPGDAIARRGAVLPEPTATPRVSKALSLTFMKRTSLPVLAPQRSAKREATSMAPQESATAKPTASQAPDTPSINERVLQALGKRGASFVHELAAATKLKLPEVEEALWQLIAAGEVIGDDVENLRLLASAKRKKRHDAMARAMSGRFALLAVEEAAPKAEHVDAIAHSFLARYGIVWRDLVMRETLATTWRELSFYYRRLEARGELRGGRFVAGVVGEQFALPDAIDLARSVRREPAWEQPITIAAIDPLNLTGVLFPGPRVPAQLGQMVQLRDGVPTLDTQPRDADEPNHDNTDHTSDAA